MEAFHERYIRPCRNLGHCRAVLLQKLERAPGLELRGPRHPESSQFIDLYKSGQLLTGCMAVLSFGFVNGVIARIGLDFQFSRLWVCLRIG